MCKEKISGRIDKIFCSNYCKSDYHVKLRRVNSLATYHIDKILHRNRSILLEILGKSAQKKKINKKILDEKKFNFSYVTSFGLNSKNKMYHYVYDFAWIKFSSNEILIVRVS